MQGIKYMKPGRELDLLVAQKIFGNKIDFVAPSYDEFVEGIGYGFYLPRFSENIVAAWAIVNKMENDYYPFYLANYDNKWSAQFAKDLSHVYGESAPHTICLAALKAKRVEA